MSCPVYSVTEQNKTPLLPSPIVITSLQIIQAKLQEGCVDQACGAQFGINSAGLMLQSTCVLTAKAFVKCVDTCTVATANITAILAVLLGVETADWAATSVLLSMNLFPIPPLALRINYDSAPPRVSSSALSYSCLPLPCSVSYSSPPRRV